VPRKPALESPGSGIFTGLFNGLKDSPLNFRLASGGI
jgi:hypothetical protein